MSSRAIDPDILRALTTNAVEAERSEREQVYAVERERERLAAQGVPEAQLPVVYYCHGAPSEDGTQHWPVVLLRSVADYDQRVRLSRAARTRN